MKKLLVVLKWFTLTVPLGLFGMITAPIMYPIYDFTKWKWLWIYDDTNRIYPDGTLQEDYRIFLIRKTGSENETFRARYLWHGFRNTIWNLRVWMGEKQIGDGSGMVDREYVIDNMLLDGKAVSDGGKWAMVCGLKWKVGPGEDPWQGWTGDTIDFRYSILGQSLMWFKQDGILSFRYSYCKLWVGYWVAIKIKCIKSSTTFHLKFQKNK
jgi:hypothetical protein